MSSSKRVILVLHAVAMTAFLALSYGPGPSSASPAPLQLPPITANYPPIDLAGTDRRAASGMRSSDSTAQLGHKIVSDDNRVNSASDSLRSNHGLNPRQDSLVLLTKGCNRAREQAASFRTYPISLGDCRHLRVIHQIHFCRILLRIPTTKIFKTRAIPDWGNLATLSSSCSTWFAMQAATHFMIIQANFRL
jgi:hypothetical protein